MKEFLLIIMITAMLGCKSKIENDSISKFREIYIHEIQETLMSIEKRYQLNPNRIQPFYYTAMNIYDDFQKIDSAITFNKPDNNLNLVLTHITDSYGKERLQKDTTLKMRINLLNHAIVNNTISQKENSILIYELCDKLFSNLYVEIDRNDYKFNYIKAYVSTNKSVVNIGETYQAHIFIAALDTFKNPRIKFRNEYVPISHGIGDIKIANSTKGLKKYNGELEWMIEDKGQIIKLPFEIKYEVK